MVAKNRPACDGGKTQRRRAIGPRPAAPPAPYTKSGMKRVLLIAYVFPPDASPGAQRPGFIAKYLPQFGWDAAPLTRSLDAPAPPLHDARASADGTAHDSRVRALLRGV